MRRTNRSFCQSKFSVFETLESRPSTLYMRLVKGLF